MAKHSRCAMHIVHPGKYNLIRVATLKNEINQFCQRVNVQKPIIHGCYSDFKTQEDRWDTGHSEIDFYQHVSRKKKNDL